MKTKVAIVGSGFGMYGLLPAFSKISGCEVVGIAGKSSERMLKYCKKFRVRRYDGWKEMLKKERPDAIAIAVIPRYQYAIAKYALENGIAVFAEKPLTTSVATSLELTRLAKKKRIPNVVDFIFPEIPEWRTAKKLLEDRRIGKILNIDVDWKFMNYDLKNKIESWKTDTKQGGGALSFYFSHTLYYLEYFMGRIKNMQCVFSTLEKSLNHGETIIDATLLFENGCTGNAHMNVSYTGQQKHAIEIIGERGTITLQNYSDSFVDNFELLIDTQKGTQKIKLYNKIGRTENGSEDQRVKVVRSIASRFISWCNAGVNAKPDFLNGARVQELIEMAKTSNSRFRQ